MNTQSHIHDISSIETAVAYILQRTARLSRFHLNQFLVPYQISPEQWFILFKLLETPGSSQSELADPVLNDHPNITRMIDALEKRALVVRQQDPDDRRRRLLHLTEAGETMMAEIMPAVVDERKAVFDGISDEEIVLFVSVLKRIEANIT